MSAKAVMIACAGAGHAMDVFDLSVENGRLCRGIEQALRELRSGNVQAAVEALESLQVKA